MKYPVNSRGFRLISYSMFIILSLTFTTSSHSRPNFTAEQLAKARKVGSEAKYPIDFDALMDEADRLGVECEGDLTDYIWMKICKINVRGAQARERTEASKKRVEESKKRQEAMRKETIRIINETADKAERKLREMENR